MAPPFFMRRLLAGALALRQQCFPNVSRAKHWVSLADLKGWRLLAGEPVWRVPGRCGLGALKLDRDG